MEREEKKDSAGIQSQAKTLQFTDFFNTHIPFSLVDRIGAVSMIEP
jgi:hypothetical protein